MISKPYLRQEVRSSGNDGVTPINSYPHPRGEQQIGSDGIEVVNRSSQKTHRWKRVLDLTCILLSLPVWLILLLAVALWVKIVSPGPLFYCQERIGFRGRRFLMFKFRTMKTNAETSSHERHVEALIDGKSPMTKLDACGDPRIIRGGRFIRASGLDELPQLLNVLRAEMSLVGPRPCTAHEFQSYKTWQCERTNALPGLTGYWQVNGKNKTTFTEMIEMDIQYSKNVSLWLDLVILARTIPAVVEQLLEWVNPVHR